MLKFMDKVNEAMIVNLTNLIECTENETFRDAYIDALGKVGENCGKIDKCRSEWCAPSPDCGQAA